MFVEGLTSLGEGIVEKAYFPNLLLDFCGGGED